MSRGREYQICPARDIANGGSSSSHQGVGSNWSKASDHHTLWTKRLEKRLEYAACLTFKAWWCIGLTLLRSQDTRSDNTLHVLERQRSPVILHHSPINENILGSSEHRIASVAWRMKPASGPLILYSRSIMFQRPGTPINPQP